MQNNPLLQYRNVPVAINMATACFGHPRESQKKVQPLVKPDELIRLRRGLYVGNIEMVKADVLGFVDNPRELDIWSNDYFLELANRIKFV